MNTVFLLMAEYETAQIPLERVCPMFGLTPPEAAKRAARAGLPVPAYRLASQKSPWLVDVHALASYLDQKKALAEEEWRRVRGAVSPLREHRAA
ncbi:MAG: pyocin activator PrtN family protein [Pseudomonas sp.]|uniref:pyocin activator PrtN family protein n=1 Tax=Stenotrophomonas sp. TaxID=69392 RepID=UPI003D6CCBA5